MLSIKNISAAQTESYFRDDDRQTEADSREDAEWFGELLDDLDLTDDADQDFALLLRGRSPKGLRLTGTNPSGKRRAGIDLTASAPKSISLAALWGKDERLVKAHRRANAAALKAVARIATQARVWDSRKQKQIKQKTGQLCGRRFLHVTSRSLDPNLHTHNIIFNTTRTQDGKWRALSNEEIFANRSLYDGIYRSILAQEVQELGYEIELRDDGWFELKGYTPEQLEMFSKRRTAIVSKVGSQAHAIARQRAALSTRPIKETGRTLSELQTYWDQQSATSGLNVVHPIPHPHSVKAAGETARTVLKNAIAHWSQMGKPFQAVDLAKFAFARVQSFTFEEFEAEIIKAQDAGELTQTGDRFTPAATPTEIQSAQAEPIVEIAEAQERHAQIVQSYLSLSPRNRERTTILTDTEPSQIRITTAIRSALKATGQIGATIEAMQLIDKKLTEVESRYVDYYEIGDFVIPTRQYSKRDLHKGKVYEVIDKDQDALILRSAEDRSLHRIKPMQFHKSVYRSSRIEVAVGDRMRNQKSNFTVTGITRSKATIRYSNGKTDQLDLSQPQRLDYALVDAIEASKGVINRALINLENPLSKENFQILIARVKRELKVYTVDQAQLYSTNQAATLSTDSISLPPITVYDSRHHRDRSGVDSDARRDVDERADTDRDAVQNVEHTDSATSHANRIENSTRSVSDRFKANLANLVTSQPTQYKAESEHGNDQDVNRLDRADAGRVDGDERDVEHTPSRNTAPRRSKNSPTSSSHDRRRTIPATNAGNRRDRAITPNASHNSLGTAAMTRTKRNSIQAQSAKIQREKYQQMYKRYLHKIEAAKMRLNERVEVARLAIQDALEAEEIVSLLRYGGAAPEETGLLEAEARELFQEAERSLQIERFCKAETLKTSAHRILDVIGTEQEGHRYATAGSYRIDEHYGHLTIHSQNRKIIDRDDLNPEVEQEYDQHADNLEQIAGRLEEFALDHQQEQRDEMEL